LELTFWGVRGSFPVARPHARRFGGNTPCVQVTAEGNHVVIDAGTGIRRLGQKLLSQGSPREITLLISHPHWDHIQGFPYFEPAYEPEFEISIFSLLRDEDKLETLFSGQQHMAFFPIPLEQLPSKVRFLDLEEGIARDVAGFRILTHRLNHPGVSSGYRLERDGFVLAYVCDVSPSRDLLLATSRPGLSEEAFLKELFENQVRLAEGADLVIYDTFFTPKEYTERPHWGHSTLEDGLEICRLAGADHLFMFHHNPERGDEELALLYEEARRMGESRGLKVHVACEGQTWKLERGSLTACE